MRLTSADSEAVLRHVVQDGESRIWNQTWLQVPIPLINHVLGHNLSVCFLFITSLSKGLQGLNETMNLKAHVFSLNVPLMLQHYCGPFGKKKIKARASGWTGLVMEETFAIGCHNFQVRVPKPGSCFSWSQGLISITFQFTS